MGSVSTLSSPGFWDNSACGGQGLGQALAQGYHLPSWVSLCRPVLPDQEEVTDLGEGWGTAIGCGVTSGYGALFCLILPLGTYLARANLRI